jgi:GMP synthase-like glutamine amidotransferase
MNIAILICDQPRPELVPKFGSYGHMVNGFLSSLGTAVTIQEFDVQQGELPTDIDAWDMYITTGSKASVHDNEAWIATLLQFITRLDEARKTLIGICFGHQLIALVRGGMVAKSDKGWGVGIAINPMINQPPWMTASAAEKVADFRLLVSHQDQIIDLPVASASNNVKVLAGNEFCPNFMVQWDDHFLSVQGHPEWQPDYAEALLRARKDIIPAPRYQAGINSLDTAPDTALFGQWVVAFCEFSKRKNSHD